MADVPHDPVELGGPCPICDVDWPCPERERQRAEDKRIRAFLRSAAFEPGETVEVHGVVARRWSDALGWHFDIGYGERGLVARYDGGGTVVESLDATAEWAEQVTL